MTTDACPFEAIVEDFNFLDDWDDRYRYLIDLGRTIPPISQEDKSPANKVDGCVSQVWLVPRMEVNERGESRLHFEGFSDAHITLGLIAVLRAIYSGRTLDEIAAIDPAAALARLDLAAHISPQRSNGMQAMVKRIRGLAIRDSRTASSMAN